MAGFILGMGARAGSMLLRPALSSVARGAAETMGSMAAQVVGQEAVDHLSTLGSSSPAGQIASTYASIVVQNGMNMATGGGPIGALMNLPGQISQVTHLAQNLSGGVRPGGTGGQVLTEGHLHEGPPGGEDTGPVLRAGGPAPGSVGAGVAATGQQTGLSANPPGGLVAPGSVGGGPAATNPPYTANPNQSIQSVTYPARPGDVGGQPGLAFTTGSNPDGTVSSIQSTQTFNVAPGTVSNPANRAMPHADVIADQIERNRAANAAAAICYQRHASANFRGRRQLL